MNKIDSDYRAHLSKEIARLTLIRDAIDQAAPTPAVQPNKPTPKPAKLKGIRAPKGHAEEAVLGVLGATGLVNGEVRAKLKAQGYKYSLHPLQMGKALNRLADQGKAVKQTNGLRVEFILPQNQA